MLLGWLLRALCNDRQSPCRVNSGRSETRISVTKARVPEASVPT